jgi:hypothetical protein
VLRAPRRIFGPKRDEVTGGWRELHEEELHNLYSRSNNNNPKGFTVKKKCLFACLKSKKESFPATRRFAM